VTWQLGNDGVKSISIYSRNINPNQPKLLSSYTSFNFIHSLLIEPILSTIVYCLSYRNAFTMISISYNNKKKKNTICYKHWKLYIYIYIYNSPNRYISLSLISIISPCSHLRMEKDKNNQEHASIGEKILYKHCSTCKLNNQSWWRKH